jgi:hypothetical protein
MDWEGAIHSIVSSVGCEKSTRDENQKVDGTEEDHDADFV